MQQHTHSRARIPASPTSLPPATPTLPTPPQYVTLNLGPAFTEPPPWTLDEVYPDTSCHTPIIFILSSGADPTTLLQRFAERKGWAPGERLHMISLGQGQGPIAEMLMEQAAKSGDWVCLQVRRQLCLQV